MSDRFVVDPPQLDLLLKQLRLPTMRALWRSFTERADREGWPSARLLAALASHEVTDRERRRFERHRAEAKLPPGKTLANLGVDDERRGQSAQVDQVVPVPVVAGQARGFEGEHPTHVLQTHGGQQPLESRAHDPPRSGASQVLVHHLHLALQPRERARSASSYCRRRLSRLSRT